MPIYRIWVNIGYQISEEFEVEAEDHEEAIHLAEDWVEQNVSLGADLAETDTPE